MMYASRSVRTKGTVSASIYCKMAARTGPDIFFTCWGMTLQHQPEYMKELVAGHALELQE